MKRFKNITLFMLISMLWCGCLKDISEEIPNNDPKITVNCFFNPTIPFVIDISKSIGTIESWEDHNIAGVKGYIFENDLLVDSLIFNEQYEYHYAQNFYTPQIGKNYRLEVSAIGFETISANSTLPDSVSIQSVQLDTMFYSASGHNVYALRIKFNDLPSNGDLYHLMVYRNKLDEFGVWFAEPVCFLSDDLSFEALSKEYCAGGMFTDASFNGQQKEILVNTKRRLNSNLNDSVQFLVELRHGSEPYYAYNKSLTIFKNTQGDIFSQPGPVIGNVNKGYGIFAGYSAVLDTVKLN